MLVLWYCSSTKNILLQHKTTLAHFRKNENTIRLSKLNGPKLYVCTLDLNWIWLFRSANRIDSSAPKVDTNGCGCDPRFTWKNSNNAAASIAIIMSMKWIHLRLYLKLFSKRAPCAVCIVITSFAFSQQTDSNEKYKRKITYGLYLHNLLECASKMFPHFLDVVAAIHGAIVCWTIFFKSILFFQNSINCMHTSPAFKQAFQRFRYHSCFSHF